MIIYRMLYGEYPFTTSNGPDSLLDVIKKQKISWEAMEVSPQAKALIKRMLVVDVGERCKLIT